MDLMKNLFSMAQSDIKKIVLPEGEEERTLEACKQIKAEKLAEAILVGNEENIKANAKKIGLDLDGITVIDPAKSEKTKEYAEALYEIRKNKGMTIEKAEKTVLDPLYYGTMMVKLGDGDGMVSGAIHTTGDLLRPGLQIIKTAPGVSSVSSFFIIMVPDCEYGDNGLFLFADCGVNIDPDSEQLASIAIATAETAKQLCNMDPKVAMLSFSTKGSAKHASVDNVVEAVKIANERRPDLAIDGELQMDAALVKSVAAQKAPGSKVAGNANVLVFPDLGAGNIAYKTAQRLGKADAIGPLCQGFAKPINDLSRGCSAEDIVKTVVVTAVQAHFATK
jgi:phosphate acetyltransferase